MMARVFQRMSGSWILLALVLVSAPVAARAEGFVDLYMGVGFPQDSDIDTDADDPFIDAAIDYTSEVDWEETPSLGFRGGYWFENWGPSFLGVGLDLSYYSALEDSSVAELDVYVTPITPLLMLRIPLGYSEDYPGGRVQPYGAVGPAFTLAAAFSELDEVAPVFDDFDTIGFGVGLDARGGLAIPIGPHFALFGEYRYTLVEPEFEEDIDIAGPPFETEVEIEPELETHHVVFGASFRF